MSNQSQSLSTLNLPFRPRPSPGPISGLSSVSDAVSPSRSAGGNVVSASLPALEALRSVFEAVNTLPCIKYIAQVSITVLKIIEEVQITNEAVRAIALRAKDIVLVVAKSCSNAPDEISGQLESDLQQLMETMSDILEFTQEISSRSTYKKLVHKGDDAAAVKSLDTRLTHAFQLFEIQSSVSLRISHQQMARHLAGMASPPTVPLQTRPRLITSTPLHVTEGLYLIRNAADGKALETEHRRPTPDFCHACMGPSSDGLSPYQVWIISSRNGRKTDYTIRNFATGASLDVYQGESAEGTQVICFPSHDGQNQTWSIYGSKAGNLLDYCTIRSHGPHTIMDGQCPAGSNCDYVHMTSLRDVQNPRASQQWSLTRIPFTLNPSASTIARAASSAAGLPRRLFVLQNMGSGSFAAVRPTNGTTPNVALQSDFKSATFWHFEHTVRDDGRHDDMFAIVTGAAPAGICSLDFYGARHIAANPGAYSPKSSYHMWKVVPAPKDGAFCFRHSATNRLLSQSSKKPLMDTADVSAFSDATCQWRIIDASTGDFCPILYDSSLAIPPVEFAGPLNFTAQPEVIPDMLVLRTGMATATMCRLFTDGLKREHSMIREMLNSGYSSLVLAPRLITGWKVGLGLYDIVMRDSEPALGPTSTFRGKNNFTACSPQQLC